MVGGVAVLFPPMAIDPGFEDGPFFGAEHPVDAGGSGIQSEAGKGDLVRQVVLFIQLAVGVA